MVTYPSDWKITSIDKLGKCYSGLSGKSADDFGTGSAYYITFLNVLKNIKVDMDALEKVSVSSGENQNAVKKGDLFFNTSSETPDEVGMCAALLSDLNNVYLNSFCFGFRLYNTSVLSPLFASYFFNSIYGRQLMSLYAQGSTRYNLSKSSFIKMEIPVPSIKEQQAIASALSDFDQHIDNLTELIEKKKAIRDGALEDLINGKIKLDGFNEGWEEKSFKDLGDILTGLTYSPDNIRPSGKLVIRSSNVQDDRLSFEDNVFVDRTCVNSEDIKKGDIIICVRNGSAALIGKSAYASSDLDATFGAFMSNFRCKNNDSSGFVYYFTKSAMFKNFVKQILGATINQITKTDLKRVTLNIPVDIEEQQAIVSVLAAMDEEIESLETEKAKIMQIREGAMDDSLTGRVRLKV